MDRKNLIPKRKDNEKRKTLISILEYDREHEDDSDLEDEPNIEISSEDRLKLFTKIGRAVRLNKKNKLISVHLLPNIASAISSL